MYAMPCNREPLTVKRNQETGISAG